MTTFEQFFVENPEQEEIYEREYEDFLRIEEYLLLSLETIRNSSLLDNADHSHNY